MGALQELSLSWALLVGKRQNLPLYRDIKQTNKGSLFGACLSDIREVSEVQTLEALAGASLSHAGTPGQHFPTLEVTGDIQEQGDFVMEQNGLVPSVKAVVR